MSYHIVVDALCNVSTNRHIANLLNGRLGKTLENGVRLEICDLAVYGRSEDNKKQLRLPNCIKIENRKIENRMCKPKEGRIVSDFFIGAVSDSMPDYTDFISFSTQNPITDAD